MQHFDDAESVGRRLREARIGAGMSQRQLSFPGCSTAYLSRIESGHRTPSLQLMRELARRLGTTEDYLAYGVEPGQHEVDPLLEAEIALRMDEQEDAERLYKAEAESDDPTRRAAGLEGLGRLALRVGNPQEAVELLEQAAELYESDAVQRETLVDPLGRAYDAVGDLGAAVALFERALRAAEERKDVLATVRYATLLSCALTDLTRFDEAGRVLSSALTHADELADPQARVRLFWAQSRLHNLSGRPELAERYAHKVIDLLELTEDTYHLARAYRLMAVIHIEQGDPEQALELLERAGSLLEDGDDDTEQAMIRLVRAQALVPAGRPIEAAELAMAVAGELSELPSEAGRSYTFLARAFAEAGDRERALELYELACEILERTRGSYLVDAYSELAELLEAEGRKDEALETLRKAVTLRTAAARTTEAAGS